MRTVKGRHFKLSLFRNSPYNWAETGPRGPACPSHLTPAGRTDPGIATKINKLYRSSQGYQLLVFNLFLVMEDTFEVPESFTNMQIWGRTDGLTFAYFA